MKVRFAVTAALLASIATTTASAQAGVYSQGGTWQSGWTPGAPVNEYWNRMSDDGSNCNVGFYVTAGYGPCANQHPITLPSPLGWTNATYLAAAVPTVNSRMVVNFRPGTYTLTFLGQVAGATPSRRFGVVSTDGSNSLNYRFGVAPETYTFTTSKDWQFYLQSYLPTPNTFLSNDANTRQFVVFANSNGGDGQFAGEWLVGGEDNGCQTAVAGCPRRSDYDYNDAMVHIETESSISTVPEPSTYAMMAVGLLALGGAARRRRRSAGTIA